MKLLRQKQNEPNCLVYSAAMVMNIDPEKIFEITGHRGQEVWWKETTGHQMLRGFHIQEIINVGLQMGYALVPYDKYPFSAPDGMHDKARMIDTEYNCEFNFYHILTKANAILISSSHAVAWDCVEQKCYDPNGLIYEIEKFKNLWQAWLVFEIKSNF